MQIDRKLIGWIILTISAVFIIIFAVDKIMNMYS